MTGVTRTLWGTRIVGMVREPDPVPLRVPDVERPLGAVHDLDTGGAQPLLPSAALPSRDPEGREVETGATVPPAPLLRRAVGPLQRDERCARPVAGREPDAPIAASVLAGPPAEETQPQHVPVEALAALEIRALNR